MKHNASVISLLDSKDKRKKQPGDKKVYVEETKELKTKILQLRELIFPDIQTIKSEVQEIATKAFKTYLDNLETYYKSISQIDPGIANAALFGCKILSKVPIDTQIAYTVAPCKITECILRSIAEKQTTQPDISDGSFKQQWEIATNSKDKFWKIQPMYRNTNQIPMAMPFVFTQRDMCETCAPLVSKFAETKNRIWISFLRQHVLDKRNKNLS